MATNLKLEEIEFHDAELVQFQYDWEKHIVILGIDGCRRKGFGFEFSDSLHFEFQQVAFLFHTELQPWGPSNYLLSTNEELPPFLEKLFSQEIRDEVFCARIQSGDELVIGYKTLVIRTVVS